MGGDVMAGRHLSNIYDHRKPDAEARMCHYYHDWVNGPMAMRQAWLHHLEWIKENEIGRPQGTDTYSVEQLEAMGMIGIYKREVTNETKP